MARDICDLMDELGVEEYHLVGYSMGAVVAVLTAAQDPRVSRLVIGGVGPAVAAQARAVHAGPTDLSRVTVPTLLIAGRDDELATNPQVLADALPDGRLRLVDGDHLAAVMAPDFAPAIIEFLAD